MFQKIKTLVLVAFMPLAMAAPLAVAPVVHAACQSNISSKIDDGIAATTQNPDGTSGTALSSDCTANAEGGESLASIASKVVNILSIVVGIVAVIMIIFGGFRYITSGGESGSVSGAKNTLIYAIVGLVIVALAQFIVHFVLANVQV